MSYFKNVKSFEDLKEQYKKLAKANHPDAGGDVEKMKDINCEFDALFIIWKNNTNTTETAKGYRDGFYTQNGWKGSKYDSSLSLKEIAKIVRTYVKEKYPTYKFSVRTEYASMCQELHVELKESPIEVYKTYEELTDEEKNDIIYKAFRNFYWDKDTCINKETIEKLWSEHGGFYKVLNETTQAVIKDVDGFVHSYRYDDCDGMIDYFDVNFYYFGCAENNGENIKIVPKTEKKAKRKETAVKTEKTQNNEPESTEKLTGKKRIYTYKITEGEDTRDNSKLWIVRIVESLTKEEYIAENKAMKEKGGYYSKFKLLSVRLNEPTPRSLYELNLPGFALDASN